jgi:radical SAM superfamily enzyme YgiQ (UPF0313 family)
MKKKILLIQSTPYDSKGNLIKKKKLYFVGLSLPLIAALTPKELEVEICLETIEDVPFDTDADVIGISSMGHAVIRSIDIAKEFKKRGKIVLMGGYMVSLMPEEAKKYCDSVIIGDVEEVWEEVLNDIEYNTLKPSYQKQLAKLSYPLPRYDLVINKKIGNFLPVQAGRGCPHSCSFCSVYCLYHNKYYQRDIDEVIRDIKYIKSLGFKRFLLLDDNIVANPEYMFKLCNEIKKLKMKWMSQCSINIAKNEKLLKAVKESGCEVLSFGLESITKESLINMNKGWENPDDYHNLLKKIYNAGIEISTEMVVGADGDTLESIALTSKFIERNNVVVPRFYILTPIPGTIFHSQMEKENRIYNKEMYSYNGSEAVHIPKNMTPEQLTKAYWDLYEDVFSYRSIIKRTLLHKRFFIHPLRSLFYFYVNIFYRYQIKQKITPNII